MLAAAGSALAGGVLATGSAAGQPRVTRRLVIPSKQSFVEGGYDGYFVHVGERSTGELDASRITECDFASWSPENTAYYNGTLIDRLDENARQVAVTVFASSDAGIQPGTLWAINNHEMCPNSYVGLQAEQIGAALVPETVSGEGEPTPTGTDGTSAFGPGFGALGAAAGVGGLLALLRRGGDD